MKPRAHHRPTPHLLAVALASVLAFGAPAALAQSTSATVRGTAAASARVTATNTATGLTRSAQSDAAGNYTLAGLPPGTYRIDVAGGGTRTVTLAIGQNATVNVGGGGPTELQVVEVVGASVAEPRTSEVATFVSEKKIESLPQQSRNFLAFADTVPGTTFESLGDGSTRLRSGAQNANGINVFIDGVGQKNYVLKGGISGQDSSRGNPFPQLAIGEYKVITSNYKAEYDQISSAAVTAVTKSGTNDFGGSFFWDRSSDFWRDRTPIEERQGEPDSQTEQWGLSVGGPIIKDRLFYFFTYEGKDIVSPRAVTAGAPIGGTANLPLPADLFALTGPVSAPFQEDLYFGKLTWQPGEDHLIELSVKQRDETEITGVGGVNTFDYGTAKTNDSTRVDLRWQFNQENWLNDAHITFEDEQWSPHAINNGIGFVFTGLADQFASVLNVGAGRDFQEKGQKGWSLQDDFTWFGFENHTIKAGFKYKHVEINAFEQQPFNPQYYIDLAEQLPLGNDSFGEYVPWRVQIGGLVPGVGSRNIVTKNKQFGFYIQDDWQVTEKLMFNLGLRWDYEQSPAWEDFVTPANIAAALRAWPNLHGPNVDYNIENYISNGSNRSSPKDNWQPRLGFSYDLFADERHVIFGGAGRTYDRNLWDYLALEQSKNTFPQYEFQFNTPFHPCDPATNARCFTFDPSFYNPATLDAIIAANPNLGAEVNLINNDIETPYADQFSLGMRNAFDLGTQQWSISTTAVHIRSHDNIVFSLGNRWPDGSFRNPAAVGATWGNQAFGSPIPGFGTLIKADNGIETRLNQFLVSLEKSYTTESPWSITFAYTYSDSEENRFNAAESDEHYLFDYPTLDGQPFLRSVGVPKNKLVVSGFADIWWDMTFSGKLSVASAYPKDSVNCHDTISFNNCFFDEFEPDVTYGYKQLDLALRKSFNTGTSFSPWVRVDVLNVFNWRSWTDYDTWRGGPIPDFNPTFGDQNGFGIRNDPRTFKLSVGFDF